MRLRNYDLARLSPALFLAFSLLGAESAYGQFRHEDLPSGSDDLAVVSPAVSSDSPSTRAETPIESQGGTNRLRQGLLIGGVAVSMAAYGYFILEFNNSRGDAGAAQRAYEEDVRQNAQTYVDQGIELDQIQTFRDWQSAYDDAKNSREWAARAGFLAMVVGFFAVLDAATTDHTPPPPFSGVAISPTVGLSGQDNNLVVGARVKF